jgi:hypothetical protein
VAHTRTRDEHCSSGLSLLPISLTALKSEGANWPSGAKSWRNNDALFTVQPGFRVSGYGTAQSSSGVQTMTADSQSKFDVKLALKLALAIAEKIK